MSSVNIDPAQWVIVGAGPAGVRAAQTLLHHGIRPVIIDEAALPGGQIYRQGPAGRADARHRYGFEWKRAQAIHQAGAALTQRADYRAQTTVWNAVPGQLDIIEKGHIGTIPFSRLLLATGATDRVLPFSGWTLPGVFTLGAAQIALKAQHCLFGPRIVFAGTGPLLYLVAYQYARAGGKVLAVLDSAPASAQRRALPSLLNAPTILAKGIFYLGWLRAHGIPVHHRAQVTAATGSTHIQTVHASLEDKHIEIDCDALAVGHGLRSETQLADLLDCEFDFDEAQRTWLPRRDSDGRSTVPGIYLAGDGAGIQGAVVAEWAGERAALAMLADEGISVDNHRVQHLQRRQTTYARFRRGLDQAFPQPKLSSSCRDTLMVCRCEGITAGQLREAAQTYNITDLNRLKALTRIGMGLCQGRMCHSGAAELLAQSQNVPLSAIGRLRSQAPIKPLSLATLGDQDSPL
jgi:NADPH-dependent 2,4-dienoyl-CoA reductase/sulfur reductase-like enzyme